MTVSCIVCTIVYRRPVSTLITISPPLRKKQRTPDSRFVRSDTFCKPTQTRASSKFSFKLRANLFDCTESIHLKNFARFHLPFSPVFFCFIVFSSFFWIALIFFQNRTTSGKQPNNQMSVRRIQSNILAKNQRMSNVRPPTTPRWIFSLVAFYFYSLAQSIIVRYG